MNWLKNKKTVAVHDGNFHPDDVFSVALLSIFYNGNIRVVRTRDMEFCSKADYVLDLGGEYNSDINRFDHHQTGGAGKRDNKIPYSTFGLLWQKFGEVVCGSKEIADILEKKIVTTVDADDNGFNLTQEIIEGIRPVALTDIIYDMRPTWKDNITEMDKSFFKAVEFAKGILLREIRVTGDRIEITRIIQDYYKKSSDKRLIITDSYNISRLDIWEALQDFPEPVFAIYKDKNNWSVVAMRKEANSFENRKNFPASWAGLRDEDLAGVSGVADAIFCHNGLFLAVAKSKEGAIKMAELALKETENNK